MMVPYGALPGFSITTEIRYIAAYYRLGPLTLRRSRDSSERVAEARQALYWRLTHERKLSDAVAGRLLAISAKVVRSGAAKHAARIKEFSAASGVTRGRRP